MRPEHNCYLVLPRFSVQNLNTISSPLTWGAPSITAVIGFMHALQRRIPYDWKVDLLSAGMVIHEFEPQVNGQFQKKFNLTRNPVGRDGKTQAIVEEGRAHAVISLVFGAYVDTTDSVKLQHYADHIQELASWMRFAGGSILPKRQKWNKAKILQLGDGQDEFETDCLRLKARELKRSLLPGFALLGRDELLKKHTEKLRAINPLVTELDAFLDLSRINYHCVNQSQDGGTGVPEDGKTEWMTSRGQDDGWLVPIPVGFGALSQRFEAGEVVQARDAKVPFRFVESVYSMGEWRSPHRLERLSDLLWYPYTDQQAGLYRCVN